MYITLEANGEFWEAYIMQYAPNEDVELAYCWADTYDAAKAGIQAIAKASGYINLPIHSIA